MTAVVNMAASESEEIDVAKEFNLLPIIFETIQALQKTNDPQEFTKKVSLCFSLVSRDFRLTVCKWNTQSWLKALTTVEPNEKRHRNKRSIVRDPKFVPLNYCNFYLYYAVTS